MLTIEAYREIVAAAKFPADVADPGARTAGRPRHLMQDAVVRVPPETPAG